MVSPAGDVWIHIYRPGSVAVPSRGRQRAIFFRSNVEAEGRVTRLLVSVRSAAEAHAALAGGADLIDVKEPSRGPLGRADDSVISAVLVAVHGRRPVSAAMGELADMAPNVFVRGVHRMPPNFPFSGLSSPSPPGF